MLLGNDENRSKKTEWSSIVDALVGGYEKVLDLVLSLEIYNVNREGLHSIGRIRIHSSREIPFLMSPNLY